MSDKYILNSAGEPEGPVELMAWAKWFERVSEERIVGKTQVGEGRVSTVFLGIDHAWGDEPGPVLWETMVFDGPFAGEQDRCSGSRADALKMHEAMVAKVRAGK